MRIELQNKRTGEPFRPNIIFERLAELQAQGSEIYHALGDYEKLTLKIYLEQKAEFEREQQNNENSNRT